MDVDDHIDLVAEREHVLDVLVDGPASPRDVLDELDTSRSTVNRALSDLEDAGLVERASGGYVATLPGRIALDRYRAHREETRAVVAAEAALAPLGPTAPLGVELLTGADRHLADEQTPYRPVEVLHDAVEGADRYRALLPALDDPRHVRILYEHVVTDGRPAELVVSPDLAESLSSEFPRRLAAMVDAEGFEVFVAEGPPFGVVVTGAGGDATVTVVVFADSGVHAVLQNDAERAVRWARELLDDALADGARATDDFRQSGN